MKNVAIIFAGGVGQRMTNAAKPKQFLEVHGKPILIHTLERFQHHPEIDGIVLVCLEAWIDYVNQMIQRYGLTKVDAVIPGGNNGHQSRYNGLKKARELYENAIVLIHDGVRPLIDHKTISEAIESVIKNGSAVVATPATETIAIQEESNVTIKNREKCSVLRAPQCFFLDEIISLYEQVEQDGLDDFIDSATIVQHYRKSFVIINGPPENIKITTPLDFFMFRGILETNTNKEVFGL